MNYRTLRDWLASFTEAELDSEVCIRQQSQVNTVYMRPVAGLGPCLVIEETDNCVRALMQMFHDIPDDFEHQGQTFYERCEEHIIRASEQLEEELDAFRANREDANANVGITKEE